MSNPRIEEVEDDEMADDPEEMDLDAFDFARPTRSLGPSQQEMDAAAAQSSPEMMQALLQGQNQALAPNTGAAGMPQVPQQMPGMTEKDRERLQREHVERTKSYQCIYPVYFDSTRSREQGRRVRKEDSVPNPLAREIVDALAHVGKNMNVGLQIALEPTKTHPKDWANPGRVKVQVKKNGQAVNAKIHNKHHLYKLISAYLKSHPTTEETPLRLQLQGLPMPKDRIPPPAIPRGSKIGTILPLHSPALSGGGVSETFLQDMMAEMGGQLPAGMGGMGGGEQGQAQKRVKDKKKK